MQQQLETQADVFGGVEFPQGAISFADVAPLAVQHQSPLALGQQVDGVTEVREQLGAAKEHRSGLNSRQKLLKDLEDMLGVALFDRQPRGMRPIWYGETMIRHARIALSSLREAGQEVDAAHALGQPHRIAERHQQPEGADDEGDGGQRPRHGALGRAFGKALGRYAKPSVKAVGSY